MKDIVTFTHIDSMMLNVLPKEKADSLVWEAFMKLTSEALSALDLEIEFSRCMKPVKDVNGNIYQVDEVSVTVRKTNL